jgi:hypothetical protein
MAHHLKSGHETDTEPPSHTVQMRLEELWINSNLTRYGTPSSGNGNESRRSSAVCCRFEDRLAQYMCPVLHREHFLKHFIAWPYMVAWPSRQRMGDPSTAFVKYLVSKSLHMIPILSPLPISIYCSAQIRRGKRKGKIPVTSC